MALPPLTVDFTALLRRVPMIPSSMIPSSLTSPSNFSVIILLKSASVILMTFGRGKFQLGTSGAGRG